MSRIMQSHVQFALQLEAPLEAAEQLLCTPPPNVSEVEAQSIAQQKYGFPGRISPLSGERDRNFLVGDAGCPRAVLKFYNRADDAPSRDLQHGALVHVHRRAPGCPVPKIIRSLDGQDEIAVELDGIVTVAVMISHMPGISPTAADLSPCLRKDIGRVIGELVRALADYHHPHSARAILWDMMLVAELRPLAALIEDADRRGSVMRWLDHFSASVSPATARLPHQAIHNDLSLSNLLIDPVRRDRVTGVIDFGDIVRAPRINEFAVAASYFIVPGEDPVSSVAEILQGAGPQAGLLPEELALMFDLIKARLVTRILLSGWRAQLFPGNRAYILRSSVPAWELWERLESQDAAALSRRLLPLVGGVLA